MNVVIAQQSLPLTLTTGGMLSDNSGAAGISAHNTIRIMAAEVEGRRMPVKLQ